MAQTGPRPSRIADSPSLDFEAKEVEPLIGDLVEPIERCSMFLCKVRRDSDNRDSIQARRVGEKLAKMGVVGSFQLILY